MKAKGTFVVLNGVHLSYLKILDPLKDYVAFCIT